MNKNYINYEKTLVNGVKLLKTKELDVVKKGKWFIIDGEHKYNRESYGFLHTYKTLEEGQVMAQKRNSEILKQITITKDNIHLYYEFMSDKDLKKHQDLFVCVYYAGYIGEK